jgi:hypothetical protein
MRAVRLEQRGYRVRTQTIPPEITPKNRLLLGERLQTSTATANTEGRVQRRT